jgi:hypothetical protein
MVRPPLSRLEHERGQRLGMALEEIAQACAEPAEALSA